MMWARQNSMPLRRPLVCVLVTMCLSSQAAADQVLLLRNGNVLEGRVFRRDDRYVVKGPSNELHVPAEDVELLTEDMLQVYDYRARGIAPDNPQSHLKLAGWCIRQNLFAQAEQQLHAAERHAPNQAMVSALRKQIVNRPSQSQDAQLPEPPARAAETAQADEMGANLPPRLLADFVTNVQPLLINRCSNATCHGPATKSGYQLAKSPWGKMPGRLTSRNLSETLRAIDPHQPERSELLTSARTAHGGAKRLSLSNDHYVRLVAWATQAAQAMAADGEHQTVSHENVFPTNVQQDANSFRNFAALDGKDPFDPEQFNRLHQNVPEHSAHSALEELDLDASKLEFGGHQRP